MLKLTRIAAVALIGLAVLLAVIALMIGRRQAAATAPGRAERSPGNHRGGGGGDCRPANPFLPMDCAWRSAAPRLPVPPPAFPPWWEGAGAGHCRRHGNQQQCACAGILAAAARRAHSAVPVDELVGAGNRIVPGDFDVNLHNAQPNASGPADAAQTRRCCRRVLIATANAGAVASTAKPMRATIHAPPTSPEAAAARARAQRPPSRHAARYWRYRWPTPTGCLLGAQQGKLFLACAADPGQPDLALFPGTRCDPLRGLDAGQRLRCNGRRITPTPASTVMHWPAAATRRPAAPRMPRHAPPGAAPRAHRVSKSSGVTAPPPCADLHRAHP